MLFFRFFIRILFFVLIIAFNALIGLYYYCISTPVLSIIDEQNEIHDENRHIWCLNHYDPKSQVEDFVKCAFVASMLNSTLILPPFFAHYRDGVKELQWFGNFYNLNSLESIVRFIRMDRWIKSTLTFDKRLKIECYLQEFDKITNTLVYAKRIRERIEEHFQIRIDFQRFINISSDMTIEELKMKSTSCRTIFLHLDSSTLNSVFSPANPFVENLFKHLHRSPLIQRIGQIWLNLLPKFVTKENLTRNSSSIVAVTRFPPGNQLATSSSSYIKQILHLIDNGVHLTHLHVISDDLHDLDLEYLSMNLPVPFTSTKDLYQRVENLFDKNLIDVLEQEIAYQATVFLAVPRTSYSTTVIMQKVYQERGNVYLFTLGGIGSPYNITRENTRYLGI